MSQKYLASAIRAVVGAASAACLLTTLPAQAKGSTGDAEIRFVRGTPGQSIFWTFYTWHPAPWPGECIEERYVNFPGQEARLDRRGLASNGFCNRDWQGNPRPIEAADRFGLVPYDGPIGDFDRNNMVLYWTRGVSHLPWDDPWNRNDQADGSHLNFVDWGDDGPLVSPDRRTTFRIETGPDGQQRCISERSWPPGPSLFAMPPSISEVDMYLCTQYAQNASHRPERFVQRGGSSPLLPDGWPPRHTGPGPNALFSPVQNNSAVTNSSAFTGNAPAMRRNMIFNDDLPPGDAVDTTAAFPNVAYVAIETSAGTGNCSGTVINRRQILTAAHCVDMADLENIRVGFGNPVDSPSFSVLSVSYHEDWDSNGLGGSLKGADIAIITLDDPVLFVPPVQLDASNTSAASLGDIVLISGYGSFGNPSTGLVSGGDGQRRIGRNVLDFVGTATDVAPLAGLVNPGTQHPLFALDLDDPSGAGPNILGGGAVDGEAIASPGDSGGGLFIETADGLVQIGIVSFGYGIANPANRFAYGAADFYTPVFAFRDWIDAASPFIQASTAGGNGSWSDAGYWADGIVPQNFNGPFTVAAGPVFTPLYEVFLDGPGLTRIEDGDFFEIDALTLSDPAAELGISELGVLIAESFIDIQAGTIYLDGVLGTSQMRVQDGGELLVTENGVFVETAPVFDGGVFQQGGLIDVAGLFFTDGLILSGGQFTLRDTGYYFDYGGSLVLDGRLDIDGYWDTDLFTQFGGLTDIGESGILFDYQGISLLGGGTLNVDGEFDTLAFIHDGGTVAGRGIILAPDIYYHANGVIMPGGPVPGTLTIDGNYYMDSGAAGAFSLHTDPALSNSLFVTGWAEIYGTIIPVFERDLPSRGDSFVLVEALDGTGGDPQLERPSFSPMIDFQLSFTGDSLVLSLIARDFADWAGSPQQQAVAGALDAALAPFGGDLPPGSFGELVNTLDYLPEGSDVSRALESLNPAETFMLDTFGFALSRVQGNILAGRTAALARGTHGGYALTGNTRLSGFSGFAPGAASMAVASSMMQVETPQPAHAWDRLPDHTGVFLTGTVSSADYTFVHGRSDSNMVFLTGGADRRVGENSLIGFSAGYGQFETRSQYRRADGEALSVSVYGGHAPGNAYVSAYAGYALMDYQIARPVFLGPPGAGGTVLTARADTGGSQFMAGFDAGLTLAAGAFEWGPALRLRHASTRFDAYTETGAGVLGSRIDARSQDETVAGLGAYIAQSYNENGRQSEIYVRAFHQIELSGSDRTAQATLTGAPVTFQVQGRGRDDRFYTLETGARIDISRQWSLDAAFAADTGRSDGNETSLSLQARWRF